MREKRKIFFFVEETLPKVARMKLIAFARKKKLEFCSQ